MSNDDCAVCQRKKEATKIMTKKRNLISMRRIVQKSFDQIKYCIMYYVLCGIVPLRKDEKRPRVKCAVMSSLFAFQSQSARDEPFIL